MKLRLTIKRTTWEALREFNERETGRGIGGGGNTVFSGDTATFDVSEDTWERLRALSTDPDEAIMIAINGRSVN